MKKTLPSILEYVANITITFLLFTAIAALAIGLNFLASSELIASRSTILSMVIKVFGYAIILSDTLLLLTLIIKESLTFARKVMWPDKQEDIE